MSDPYLLLTPILMLGVLALVRFIGCNQIFGLDETVLIADPPDSVTAVAGDGRVDLSWFYQTGRATAFTVLYGTNMGGPYPATLSVPPASGSQHGASVAPLLNGTTYYFIVTVTTSDSGRSSSSPRSPKRLSLGRYVAAKKGRRSGVRTTVMGQPPLPVTAWTAVM